MLTTSKEHDDLMATFESGHKGYRLDREDKENWKRGAIYQDGRVNDLFLAYRKGYSLGMISSQAEKALAAAPVAMMDTREALGICALAEEDFPAIYALQGHRVALVDLGKADAEIRSLGGRRDFDVGSVAPAADSSRTPQHD